MTPITEDFSGSRLDQVIDLRRPLPVLASRLPWQEIEASIAHLFAKKVHAGQTLEDVDLFGPSLTALRAAGSSNAGRPRLPLRLMISLLYLKHAFDEIDEALVQRWSETPGWQYFSGQDYFENRLPCAPTLLVKFRCLLGGQGVEELLARTLEAAKVGGIAVKQTFAKEGQLLGYKAGRYAHARQFRGMRKVIKRQRTIVGRLQREVARKMSSVNQAVQEALGKAPKLYSWHASEVECISKRKSRTPYEFGVKVGIAMTLKGNLILGAGLCPATPMMDTHYTSKSSSQAS